jgi:hypothetical protein
MCKHESNKNSHSNNEVDFTGTWEGIRVEGLDDFLCVLKVNMIKRGVAAMVTPTNVIRHEGDQIEVAVELGPVTERVEGTIGGPEFGSKMPIGDKCTRALKWCVPRCMGLTGLTGMVQGRKCVGGYNGRGEAVDCGSALDGGEHHGDTSDGHEEGQVRHPHQVVSEV